jgi:prepilin-type N-terminal cleavage/methylation domain-containing protein
LATKRSNGFTLLEVLLAVVILGISLTVFLQAAGKGIAFVSDAQGYERSRTFLNRLDLEEPLDLENLEEGVERGTLDGDDDGTVRWTRTITIEGKEEDELYHIRSEVSWGRDILHEESVETLLHQPTAIQGGWVKEPVD